eukprot:scaffold1819_cov160-Amphora_coffeaeformis.AAC.11
MHAASCAICSSVDKDVSRSQLASALRALSMARDLLSSTDISKFSSRVKTVATNTNGVRYHLPKRQYIPCVFHKSISIAIIPHLRTLIFIFIDLKARTSTFFMEATAAVVSYRNKDKGVRCTKPTSYSVENPFLLPIKPTFALGMRISDLSRFDVNPGKVNLGTRSIEKLGIPRSWAIVFAFPIRFGRRYGQPWQDTESQGREEEYKDRRPVPSHGEEERYGGGECRRRLSGWCEAEELNE